jgi:hypothetical protein
MSEIHHLPRELEEEVDARVTFIADRLSTAYGSVEIEKIQEILQKGSTESVLTEWNRINGILRKKREFDELCERGCAAQELSIHLFRTTGAVFRVTPRRTDVTAYSVRTLNTLRDNILEISEDLKYLLLPDASMVLPGEVIEIFTTAPDFLLSVAGALSLLSVSVDDRHTKDLKGLDRGAIYVLASYVQSCTKKCCYREIAELLTCIAKDAISEDDIRKNLERRGGPSEP